MNRFRLLLFTTFVVAVTALPFAVSITYAGQDPAAAKPAAEQDPAAVKRAADAAVRARAQRDAAIKRRHDTKKYIQKVIEGQQPGATAPAPGNAGKEGTK